MTSILVDTLSSEAIPHRGFSVLANILIRSFRWSGTRGTGTCLNRATIVWLFSYIIRWKKLKDEVRWKKEDGRWKKKDMSTGMVLHK
jgi:hypothetical protein